MTKEQFSNYLLTVPTHDLSYMRQSYSRYIEKYPEDDFINKLRLIYDELGKRFKAHNEAHPPKVETFEVDFRCQIVLNVLQSLLKQNRPIAEDDWFVTYYATDRWVKFRPSAESLLKQHLLVTCNVGACKVCELLNSMVAK